MEPELRSSPFAWSTRISARLLIIALGVTILLTAVVYNSDDLRNSWVSAPVSLASIATVVWFLARVLHGLWTAPPRGGWSSGEGTWYDEGSNGDGGDGGD